MNTVFHITESFGGGVLTSIKNLTEVQNASNYNVTIVFLRRKDTPEFSDLRLMFPDIELLEIGSSNLKGFIKLFKFVNQLLLKRKNSIFHAHSSWAGVLVRIANSFIRKSKCFYTPHGYAHMRTDVSSSKRKFFQFTEILLNLISKTNVIACGKSEALIANKLFAQSVNISSNFLKDPFPDSRKPNTFIPRKSKKFKIATIGRITPQKGPERFLQATKFFDHFVEIEWIGSGAPGNLLAQNNVKITGWLQPNEVSRKIANLDALMITSEWEGLSMVGLEALSHGVPIISSAYYGCEDLVKHGFNGFICHNEQEFSHYINLCFFDWHLMTLLKSNARQYFLDNFDQKILYMNWKEMYKIGA